MLKPIQQNIFNKIDSLLESDYKIELNEDLYTIHEDNLKFQKVLHENRMQQLNSPSFEDDVWTKIAVDNRIATIHSCKHFRNLINNEGDGKSWREHYQISEVAFTERQNLFTTPFHPYKEKYQELMDRSFEAGLPVAWERFH